MRTTIHNHLRGQNGCLGFYYGLASLLSAYPEGGLPGEFFINGETQSIWIWDSTGRSWYDTNHAAPSPFMGIITEPATFSPAVESGVQACFIYVAGGKGAYVFPALKGSAAMTVTTDSSAIITLVWDGTAWRNYVTPLTFDDAVRPVYLYRGTWNPSFTYRCTGGVADVVYFMGKYYQVKFSVGSTTASPASSNDWEELSRFCAIADEIKLKPNGLVLLDGQQTIRVSSELSSWELCNGEISHKETGTFLSQAGELRVPIGEGEVVISPLQKGIVVYSGDGDKVFQIGLDAAGEALLKMTRPIENGSCEVSISPRQIEISRLDGTGLPVYRSLFTADGLNCALKKWTDILSEGDIYVDENNFVRQKKGA